MKRIFKIIAIIFGVLIVILAVAMGLVLFLTGDQREIARSFVIDATSGNIDAVLPNMHPELIKEVPRETLQQMFGNAKQYTDVSFSSTQANGARTELGGTASTDDGCVSEVSFVILKDKIIGFNIEPLCSN